MSTVTLSIGPKSYTVACADGQEAHIRALGAMISEKYAQLGSSRAPLEAQNLLFAALFLADELAEARKRPAEKPEAAPQTDPGELERLREAVTRLEVELQSARQSTAAPSPTPSAASHSDLFGGAAASDHGNTELAEKLEALAAHAEASATALEAAAASA